MLPIKRLQLEDLDKIVLQVFLQLQEYLVAKSVLGVRFCVSPILISNKIETSAQLTARSDFEFVMGASAYAQVRFSTQTTTARYSCAEISK